MARGPLPPLRKRRTREHVIADLSVNFVERQVLLAGHTVERVLHDYGVDLLLSTYAEDGMPETGLVYFQIKATDRPRMVANGGFVACRIERAHLRAWLVQPFPVILIVYDAPKDRAYWTYIQESFGGVRRFRSATGSATLTVRLPVGQALNVSSIEEFRRYRARIAAQTEGVIHG